MAERNTPTYRSGSSTRKYEEIKQIQNRVDRARQIRRRWREDYKVKDLYRAFYGDVAGAIFDAEIDDEMLYVNKFLPTIKTVIPSLFLQNPTFIVRSKLENQDPTSILKAKMGEAALRSIAMQERHLEFSTRLALIQSFFSIGVLKTVYEPKMVKNPRAGETMFERDPSGIPILDESSEPIELADDSGYPMIEPDMIVDDESYRWDWVNGDRMLLPDAGPAHLRWPWIGEEVTVLLDRAREDERFPKNLRTQLKANELTDNLDDMDEYWGDINSSSDETGRKQDQYITYIEIWDLLRQKHIIWAPDQTFSETQCLLNRDVSPGIEHHPYSMLLGYTPIIAPKPLPWPLPYTYGWLGIQREHNVRRKQVANAARRTARKVFFEEGTFPDADEAVKFLQSNEDMQAVKITDVTRPPVVNADPPMTQTIAQDLSVLEADWAFETGVTGPRTGGRNTGAESVYESKIQVQSGEVRDLDMRHAVNVFLETSGRKMFRLLKATMTVGMYVKLRGASDSHFISYVSRVYGPQMAQQISQFPNLRHSFDQQFGQDKWLELSPEELDFEADVGITPGSSRPRNMENEKQDFLQIIQFLGQFPMIAQSRALLARVADMFEFFDTSMIDEIVAIANKANEMEQMKAGRLQGGSNQQAALGGGANMSTFRRNFVG